jgi:hypothetical protein
MYIEVGKTYRTHNGKRAFYIYGKKNVSATGFFYAGECIKTGLTAYFNANGEHSHQSEYWLEVDTSRFMPVLPNGTMGTTTFVKREDIPHGRYIGYLHMVNGAFQSISFVDKVK